MGVCVVFRILTLLGIRYLLSTENRRRDAEPVDTTYADVYIERLKEDGVMEKVRVDKVCRFWYVLSVLSNGFTGVFGSDGQAESRF